ncbi:hypothetical protein DC3_38680 [Deinococcus cellulosilyticus NBRC 106333 = KACC 11606]|uniref:Uncharacterized protein n=1 Tax=Deinococcus cellulosilyticus (strain DSM 18568 / NBRC 106333 / KACC 11606 / 5516J-15) TaxID=1223518 RepID=A0A511N5U8_DEIC1|nr:hypothetical protein DC3_38680 [Deinococcus cellulosilyticus NBRC 106333 = KACC 11606]
MAGSLVAYGAVYNHFRPRAGIADPELAFRMIPLELIFGLLMGFWVYRTFGSRLQDGAHPRLDIQERMLFRLLARKGGKITWKDIQDSTPLSEQDARNLLQKWVAEGRLREVGQQEFVLN